MSRRKTSNRQACLFEKQHNDLFERDLQNEAMFSRRLGASLDISLSFIPFHFIPQKILLVSSSAVSVYTTLHPHSNPNSYTDMQFLSGTLYFLYFYISQFFLYFLIFLSKMGSLKAISIDFTIIGFSINIFFIPYISFTQIWVRHSSLSLH